MRLITHNAYWLQGAPSLWGGERSQPHPEAWRALTDLYRRLAPEVLCLQEIHAPEVAASLAADLGLTGVHAPGGLRPEYGGAVLWRGSEGLARDRSHTRVAESRVFERICIELRLSVGARALTVVDVHLASNRYAPQRRGAPVRLAEVAALLAAVPHADVVAGDFNARVDSAVHRRLEEAGFDDVCGDDTLDSEVLPRRVDYVWVRRDAGITVTDARVVTGPDLALPGRPEVALSDHPALVVDLQLGET